MLLPLLTILGLSLVSGLDQVLECPRGYIARGQSVYSPKASLGGSDTSFQMCLLCMLDSALEDQVQVCLVKGFKELFQIDKQGSESIHGLSEMGFFRVKVSIFKRQS